MGRILQKTQVYYLLSSSGVSKILPNIIFFLSWKSIFEKHQYPRNLCVPYPQRVANSLCFVAPKSQSSLSPLRFSFKQEQILDKGQIHNKPTKQTDVDIPSCKLSSSYQQLLHRSSPFPKVARRSVPFIFCSNSQYGPPRDKKM